ncbi:MAG: hypothetical protein J07HB67_02697, partial [halophilic archaeon J07HB67]
MDDASSGGRRQFEAVDWDRIESEAGTTDRQTLLGVGLSVVVVGVFSVDYLTPVETPLAGLSGLDWLLFGAATLFVSIGVSVFGNRERGYRQLRAFTRHRLAVAGAVYLGVFFAVGVLGPVYVSEPRL